MLPHSWEDDWIISRRRPKTLLAWPKPQRECPWPSPTAMQSSLQPSNSLHLLHEERNSPCQAQAKRSAHRHEQHDFVCTSEQLAPFAAKRPMPGPSRMAICDVRGAAQEGSNRVAPSSPRCRQCRRQCARAHSRQRYGPCPSHSQRRQSPWSWQLSDRF